MDDDWKLHRSLMGKPFQFSQLKGMAKIMVSVTEHLVDYLSTLPSDQVQHEQDPRG
jgi:hypothetical protein